MYCSLVCRCYSQGNLCGNYVPVFPFVSSAWVDLQGEYANLVLIVRTPRAKMRGSRTGHEELRLSPTKKKLESIHPTSRLVHFSVLQGSSSRVGM